MSKQTPNLLLDLPLELLLLILENVSSVDIMCLSLCNHRLLSLFPREIQNLSRDCTGEPPDSQRVDLLTRLSHDSPEFFLCYGCLKLHLSQTVCLPSPSYRPRACWWRRARQDSRIRQVLPMHFPGRSWYAIYFEHVQLAMRGIRYGPQFGIPMEAFHYKEVRTEPLPGQAQFEGARVPTTPEEEKRFQRSHRTILFSVDARVCLSPPGLYLRDQGLLVVEKDNLASFIAHFQDETTCLWVCLHINHRRGLRILLKDLSKAYSDDVATIARSQALCDRCNISWLIEIRSLSDDKVCFNLTLWRELGPGLSPDDDPRWYRQTIGGHEYEAMEENQKCDPRHRFEKESIQANDPNALSIEALFQQNISLLRKQRYRTVMTRWPLGEWRSYTVPTSVVENESSCCVVS